MWAARPAKALVIARKVLSPFLVRQWWSTRLPPVPGFSIRYTGVVDDGEARTPSSELQGANIPFEFVSRERLTDDTMPCHRSLPCMPLLASTLRTPASVVSIISE